MYTIITENDESAWADETGILYHFPKRYLKHLEPGTNVIYYKGSLKNKSFAKNRLSDAPHYFAIAKIGKTYPDKESSKNDFFATITDFIPFEEAVLAKDDTRYLETIPDSRKFNYWRDGVRAIDKDTYYLTILLSLESALIKFQSQRQLIYQMKLQRVIKIRLNPLVKVNNQNVM